MSDSVQPDRRQPTRLPRPWDSPGKNTGVGCHFLLQSKLYGIGTKADKQINETEESPEINPHLTVNEFITTEPRIHSTDDDLFKKWC